MSDPSFQGISHIALSVDDVPAAMAFWTGVMGFEATTDTPTLGFVVHRPTRVAIAVTDNDGAVRGPFDERHCGLDHLAFAVSGPDVLHDWSNSLEQHGIPHSPVTDSGSGHHLNLLAPGGTPIELYAINSASAAAFGIAGPEEAFAGSGGAP